MNKLFLGLHKAHFNLLYSELVAKSYKLRNSGCLKVVCCSFCEFFQATSFSLFQ